MSSYASRVILRELLTQAVCANRKPTVITIGFSYRHYATTNRGSLSYTQPNMGSSSLLSQALDQKQRGSKREDSVGPFQLGLSQTSFENGTEKKWTELSPKGKAIRATARTTNLTVILFGAGLTAVLVYALTSELFSRNSPTVLYNEACERIKYSPRVARYLPGSLAFHNNPPTVLRPRHRNRHVSSQIVLDSSGREHMLLNFYVQADSQSLDLYTSHFESASSWVKNTVTGIQDLSWQEAKDWITFHTRETTDSAKDLFRYLSGDPMLPKSAAARAAFPKPQTKESPEDDGKGLWSSLTGLFGSLKSGNRKGPQDGTLDAGHGRVWQEGEVHADLVRDDSGYFVFRYILIDIPSSQSRNPLRVFVERADGVRENEPVVRWDVR
ncbi:TIM21-domain-containing protein [Multifurca ochricompacta]|uniref:Mitochondrial import inner membrane translocase subunit Tim21 n=1 Tax=Multifurca ochricompacta TaxID=376703 RepID=A0AAD4MCP6_9AGAM|nr:TIM21-domain-containing protein [Multifurca ochricompacta]